MSRFSFTPGPWGYTGRSETGHVDSIYIYSKNPECKRQTCVGEVYMDDAEPQSTEANARLITAAPEMKVWIEEMREAIIEGNSDAISALLTTGRALLRRIEGEDA